MKKGLGLISIFIVLVFLFGCTNVVKETAGDAVDQSNPSLCKKLEEEKDVKECYAIVAEEMNDPEVCKQSTDNNGCITNFATEKSSLKYCDMTTDEAAKYSCIVTVTGDQTGRALDEILMDWRSKGAVSKCKEQCKSPYDSCMDKCYQPFKAAEEQCAGMSDTNDKYFCMDEAKKTKDYCWLDCYDAQKECEAGCMPKED